MDGPLKALAPGPGWRQGKGAPARRRSRMLVQSAVAVAVLWAIGLNLWLHPSSSFYSSIGLRVGRRLQPGDGIVRVAVGAMVTYNVSAPVIEAIHYSVQDFNAAQDKVHIELRFFTGKEPHPMVAEGMADQVVVGAINNATPPRGVPLPQFVRGKFKENMNDGKTREWFRYAVKAFPASDWIMKLDADVSVNWRALQPILLDTNVTLRYIGVVNDWVRCGGADFCPPKDCLDMVGKCWVYMSGGFYGLSGGLARTLARCMYYKDHAVGHEDMKLGEAIKACAPRADRVRIINVTVGEAWCHSKKLNTSFIRRGWSPGDCM